MVSALDSGSSGPPGRVRVLAGDIVLCPCARHFHSTFHRPGVQIGTGELNAGGNRAMDLHPIQGGVEIFVVASCYRNRDKLRQMGHLARMRT